MKNTISKEFKKTFLLMFTRELIKHSVKADILKLEKIIETEERQREIKPVPIRIIPIRKQIPVRRTPLRQPARQQIPIQTKKVQPQKVQIQRPIIKPATQQLTKPSLLIPEPKLPEHLEYLRPVPTQGTEIDLWKLNPLLKDPAVRIIEVNPDEKVKVTGRMGTKQTDIILNKEDITRVINRFSEMSRIPVTEGIYKVVVGNLILSAVISEVVGSRFMIKKIAYPAQQQYRRMAQQGQIPQPPIIPQRTPFLGK